MKSLSTTKSSEADRRETWVRVSAAFPTSGGSVNNGESKLLCPMCEKEVALREDTYEN